MTEASSGAGTGSGKYGLGIFDLRKLMEFRGHESLEEFNKIGGPQELAKKLNTDTEKGVKNNQSEVNERQQTFGKNSIPPKEPQTIWELCMATLEDETLQILIFCAVFSVVLAFFNLATSDCSANKVELQCEPRFNATHDSGSARFMEQRFLNYHISEDQIQETDMRNFARAGGDLCDKNIPALVKYADFVEGGMIIFTILIIMFLTAGNDYFKEKQFRSLQDKLSNDKTATVIRDGENQEVLVSELVVGDLVQIKYGDLLPADGMLVASNDLKVDESSLTGESDHVKKGVNKDPALLGGTHVMEGSGRMIVTAVGVNSQSGIIFVLLGAGGGEANQEQPGDEENQNGGNKVEKDSDSIDASDETKSILQAKLDELTVVITYVGTAACFITLAILTARFVFTMLFYSETYQVQLNSTTGEVIPQADLPDDLKIKPHEVFPFGYCALSHLGKALSFVIIGVTVLVVAIPEGLPLAVTISLALSVKKMMKDNNLVRHLDSCETMGNATAICSDKTGTLTTNRMTVVQSYLNAKIFRECVPNPMIMPTNVKDLLLDGIAINTSYTSKVVPDENGGRDLQLGNKTECALLGFVNEMAAETGVTYQDIRDKHPESSFVKVYTFNSARKSMSTIINNGENGFRIFTKGASEIICRRSAFILNQAGEAQKFGNIERKQMQENVINTMASDGLRTIGLAYRDVPADFDLEDENEIGSNLTLIGVVGIEDPVRPEVPKAIKQCQMAGITVRMVTGDNVMTARSIAQKCGIIEPGDTNSLVLEGKEFNKEIRDIKGNVKQSKIDEIWPRLRVLARSSPADKHTLVKGMIDSKLAEQGLQIVAVTGDGTNDGPALKVADVGFAMGIAGTDVAKEASDIILIDDNFRSIVRAVMWGRNVYDNISKFLQFQLTVNVCAILCAVIGSATTGASPLKAVQMLWVNLIMDTFASIALAAEPPTEALLNRKPYPRNKALISVVMAKNIFCHAFYQFIIMLIALFLPQFLPCNRNLPAGDVEKGRITQCWGSGETKDPAATWGVTPYDRYELTGKMAKSFPTEQFTLVFNLFVCLQLFNQINARMIHGEWNVFKGILNNRSYLIILIGEFLAQIFMVQQAGQFTTCSSLDVMQWVFCILVGATELIFGQVVNVIPTVWFESLIGFIVQTRQNLASSKIEVEEHANTNHHRGKREQKQIDVVKRYSIAPGEMSNTDLTKVRQSLHRNNCNEPLEPTLKNQNQPLDTIPSGEMTTAT